MKTLSLGLDMAALTFAAALWFDEKRHAKASFPNNRRGFRQLSAWLKSHAAGAVRVGIECTNTYGQAVARWLYEQGHQVYLLNPERTSHYAKARGQGNKTDPADAVTIAAFVAKHELTPWSPPPPEQVVLCALTRTRTELVRQKLQLANQLRTAHPTAQRFLKAVWEQVRQQISALEKKLREHLAAHPSLEEKAPRLQSITGIGWLTAVTAIAELPNIDEHTDARAICAWAGLVPRRWQSGKTELPARLSRKGNKHLRQALYMPALVALRHNPLLKAFAEKLRQRGKHQTAIIGAVSHKLLRIIVGLLKSNTTFDPHWSFS